MTYNKNQQEISLLKTMTRFSHITASVSYFNSSTRSNEKRFSQVQSLYEGCSL